MSKKTELDECPYCSSLSGYCDRCVISISYCFEWNGEPNGATDGSPVRGGKKYYCCDCNKDVTKYVKVGE